MNLEDLQDMWTADAKIDITEPSKELARIPILHAKYARELNNHFIKEKSLLVKLRRLEQFKKDYYSGNLNNPEDLAKYNIEPFQGHLTDIKINKMLERDQDILDMSLNVEIHKRAAEFCRELPAEGARCRADTARQLPRRRPRVLRRIVEGSR